MLRVRRRLGAGALLVGLSVSCVACAAIFGFEELGGENYREPKVDSGTPPDSSAPDAPPGDVFVPIPGCDGLGIPEKPTVNTSSDDDKEEILVGISTLDIGIGNQPAVGYNLDRACTPSPYYSTCIPGANGSDFDEFVKDIDEAGTDNAGFSLLKKVGAFGDGFKPSEINKRLREGEFGGVIRITKWNGKSDDSAVLVEVFPALGVLVNVGGGVFERKTSSTDGGFVADDRWLRDARFKDTGGVSKQLATNAWVAGGRVYARYAKLVVPVNVPDDPKPLDLTMTEAIVSGKLVNEGGAYRISDGVVGGRIATSDFLGNVRSIYILDNNGIKNDYVCTTDAGVVLYSIVKNSVCAARDILVNGEDRSKGCNAFSVGFRVDTYALSNKSYYEDEGNFEAQGPDATAPRCTTGATIRSGDNCDPLGP